LKIEALTALASARSSGKLPNYTNSPPGGWKYLVPETGKTIGPFSGWKQCSEILRGHYLSAGYEMPKDIFEKVEAQICGNFPEYCGEPPKGYVERFIAGVKSAYHTFHNAKQCLITLVSNRAGSGERPSQELLDSRAKTCSECPMNLPIIECSTCNMATLNSLIQKLAGAGKTMYDDKLQFCAVCHCNLKAKIATKHEAIWTHMAREQKERLPREGVNGSTITCWLISENYDRA
jgi:hypothetical protein